MNLFKKALVASAIVTACGTANAADLTQPDKTFSTEGVALIDTNTQATLTTAPGTFTNTRIIVRELMDASDEISLTFSKGVLISTVELGVVTDSAATNTVSASTAANGVMGVDYGTGDFELTLVGITTVAATGITTVKLKVKTGTTIGANDSFEIFLDAINLPASGVATVDYSAVSGISGDPKDTTGNNTASLVKKESQYGASVTAAKVLNGLIERESQVTFTSGSVLGKTSNDTADTFEVKITDNQALELAVTASLAKLTVTGNFADDSTPSAVDYLVTATGIAGGYAGAYTTAAAAGALSDKVQTVTNTDSVGAGVADTITVKIDANDNKILPQSYTVEVAVDTDLSTAANAFTPLLASTSVGEWEIDATLVNLPYVPVNFDGLNSIVHMTNKSGSAVDVMVSGYSLEADGSSETYSQVSLVTIPAYSMVKVDGKNDIAAAFSITDPTKLNVTFNIGATKDSVDVYAFSNTSNGRTEISNSTQKAIK
jgi:hypothetical protein